MICWALVLRKTHPKPTCLRGWVRAPVEFWVRSSKSVIPKRLISKRRHWNFLGFLQDSSPKDPKHASSLDQPCTKGLMMVRTGCLGMSQHDHIGTLGSRGKHFVTKSSDHYLNPKARSPKPQTLILWSFRCPNYGSGSRIRPLQSPKRYRGLKMP